MPQKTKTLDQIERMKSKAAQFVRDVVGDFDRAEEFEDMTPEEYAEHKHVMIENPKSFAGQKGRKMARSTRDELETRIEELEEENQTLNEKLDSILDIASTDEEESDDDDEEDDEEA